MAETFCDSGAVKLKAGTNAPTLTAAQYTQLINQAESDINVETRINYIDTYAALNADVKYILEDAASSKAAMGVIAYNPNSYFTTREAELILDVNNFTYTNAITKLKEKKYTDFIDGA